MNFNLRTFRLYGGDLWGTLLLSPTLTRTLKHLILLRRSSKRFVSRRSYGAKRMGGGIRGRRVISTMRSIRSKLSVASSLKLRNTSVLSSRRSSRRGGVYRQLRKLLPYRFFARKFSGLSIAQRFDKKDGSRFVVDFLKSNPFDKVFVSSRKRTFLSQLAMNYRKFQKFYVNMGRSQFARIAYQARLERSNNFHFLINRLERRLDMALFRTGLATSLFMAKHFISYKHVRVNGYSVQAYSYVLALYDKFSISAVAYRSLRSHLWFRFSQSLQFNRLRPKGLYSRLPVVHLTSSSSYEVDYVAGSSILIAEVFFNSLYYPFKIDPSNIELYINRAKKRLV